MLGLARGLCDWRREGVPLRDIVILEVAFVLTRAVFGKGIHRSQALYCRDPEKYQSFSLPVSLLVDMVPFLSFDGLIE